MLYVALWQCVVMYTIKQVYSDKYCQCNPLAQHPQTHYCAAKFIIKAKILDKTEEVNKKIHRKLPTTKYTVEILHVYKTAKRKPIPLGIKHIWTLPLCCAYLTVNATNIIMGHIKRNLLQTTYCNWNPVFLSLSKEQERGITKDYRKGCRCKVQLCDDLTSSCFNTNKKNCVLNWVFPQSFIAQCYFRYGVCRKMKGKCVFKEPFVLKICVEYQKMLLEWIEEGSGGEGSGSGDGSDNPTDFFPSNSLDDRNTIL